MKHQQPAVVLAALLFASTSFASPVKIGPDGTPEQPLGVSAIFEEDSGPPERSDFILESEFGLGTQASHGKLASTTDNLGDLKPPMFLSVNRKFDDLFGKTHSYGELVRFGHDKSGCKQPWFCPPPPPPTAVPEPATLLLGGMAAAGLLLRRRSNS